MADSRDRTASPSRSSKRTKVILGLLSLTVLGVIACGTVLSIEEDPTPVPPGGQPPGTLPDAADFPEGSVVLLDGAVVLPDGAVVDGAAADSGVDAADAAVDQLVPPGCPGIAACVRYVFVTSDSVGFTVAEPSAAAAHCNALAAASGNAKVSSRTFEGWVSTTGSPVDTRLVHGTMPYKDVLDMVIASNWTDLTKGSLSRTPFINEKGLPLTGGLPVWTGTGADGRPLGPNCGEWADSARTATRGSIGGAGANWSAFAGAELSCDPTFARLYCIEK